MGKREVNGGIVAGRLTPEEAPAGPMTATGIRILDFAVGVFANVEAFAAAAGRAPYLVL